MIDAYGYDNQSLHWLKDFYLVNENCNIMF